MQTEHFDIVINGGGMVGAALACGLTQHNFRVAVIERCEPAHYDTTSLPDIRISAISRTSAALLDEIGAWSQVLARRCAPYRRLETWEWESAKTEFSAALLKLPELGFMVENQVLQRVLWERMEELGITLFSPAALDTMTYQPEQEQWSITLDQGTAMTCSLLVGADGAHSQVRQGAGIGIQGWDYQQACMLISVECAYEPGETTWQQFTPHGPRAFLPLYDRFASLVWYDSAARIDALKKLSPAQLDLEIAQHFPACVGQVKTLRSGAFPLTRRHANTYIKPGIALVGDAAHTINPLAGQGVNLGYRDIDALIDVLICARRKAQPWWRLDTLKHYQRKRYADNLVMQTGMDLFYFTFSNQHPPLKVLRNVGLMAAQRGGWLKRKALSYALGL
ncbi:3-demethoxyubiquinol 3-hydroxylase [Rosenbergiella collisarenosi]|uniref:3-demethoxyubiquinol 3-hydroxylase n=1 Tax=Rosenbergiella collisarenosi TaxID=1544695 RepID=UPI001BD9A2C2|nr:3-demethoxyubiquinol 3-hydroxylase [Rosenbergiella collisarenosi]MBT0721645.1 2-octaprenyl-3-methyl-6-methoxy-1,4-benzoquinol hydroxylase [Rosenbergiella collisarenosi]